MTLLAFAGYAGNEGGHGGDPLAIEFVSRGHEMVALLKNSPRSPLTSAQIEALDLAVRQTPIELVDQLNPDPIGGIVIAMVADNPRLPGGKIVKLWREKWREKWREAMKDDKHLNKLVIHEYLRVIGLGEQDRLYGISLIVDRLDRAQPKEFELQELIKGDLIPFSEPFYPFNESRNRFPSLYDNILPGEPANVRTQSIQSHAEACANWKNEATRQLGHRILRIKCGEPRTHKQARGTVSEVTISGEFIGYLTYSTGTILIYSDEDIGQHSEDVWSQKYPFDFDNFNSILAAHKSKELSFKEICNNTKDEVAKQFANRFLYVSPFCQATTWRAISPNEDVFRNWGMPSPVAMRSYGYVDVLYLK